MHPGTRTLVDGRPGVPVPEGSGHFTTLRVRGGRVLLADLHRARLERDARALGGPDPSWTIVCKEIATIVGETEDAKVRVSFLRRASGGWTRILTSSPWREPPGPWVLRPVPAPGAPVAAPVKHTDRAHYEEARQRGAGADDALLWDEELGFLETSVANVFWVRDRTLLTPPARHPILPGLVRGRVLEQARGLGIETEERSVSRESARAADACFATNAVVLLHPVSQIVDCARYAPWPGLARLREAVLRGGAERV